MLQLILGLFVGTLAGLVLGAWLRDRHHKDADAEIFYLRLALSRIRSYVELERERAGEFGPLAHIGELAERVLAESE